MTSDSLGTGLEAILAVVAPDETLEPFFTKPGTAWFQAFCNFSQSVSTRVGRVLIIALRCVLAQRDNASDRQPLEAFWRGIIELQVDTR